MNRSVRLALRVVGCLWLPLVRWSQGLGLQPLFVAGALLMALWFGMALAPQAVLAAPDELACPADTEQSGGLCYPLCPDGFAGSGPICWQKCPAGQVDDGAFCRKDAQVIAKQSYTRGGGSPLACAPNQEGQGGLCYARCAGGYYGVGPVCWQSCRAGYADHGATCFRNIFDFHFKATYGRGAGSAVSACSAGLERSGALCYPRCAAGYSGVAATCFQTCPAGFRDDGAVCRKDAVITTKSSFGRGAGAALNTVPVALDDTVTTPKNTAVDIVFRHEDFDDDRGLPTTIVQQPVNGIYDGERYTPNQNFEGEDRLLWKTNDGKNDSNVAIITILVGSVGSNSAPVALDRTVIVNEDLPITITVTCTDADSDDLFYQLLEAPSFGTYQWLPPNQVVYKPAVNFVGTDSFSFRSHDGQALSNVSIITLSVGAVNDAPLAHGQQLNTPRNANLGISLSAEDAEGDPITYTVVASPTNGLLFGVAPDLIYVPNDNFVGDDNLVFHASDNQGALTEATVAIRVHANNNAPLASSLAFTTSEETSVAVNLAAGDADGDAITFTLVTMPTHGVLDGVGADWVYTPEAGFVGADSFVYRAGDGAATADAGVSLQVQPGAAQSAVTGFAYDDEDKNQQISTGERGVDGLTVTLTAQGVASASATGRAASITTQTDSHGAWRIEDVPFGVYMLHIGDSNAVRIAEPFTASVTVANRSLTQTPFAAVDVTWRGLYLPSIMSD